MVCIETFKKKKKFIQGKMLVDPTQPCSVYHPE